MASEDQARLSPTTEPVWKFDTSMQLVGTRLSINLDFSSSELAQAAYDLALSAALDTGWLDLHLPCPHIRIQGRV